MAKMEAYEFPAPWLNGEPIDAPRKVDMIDWYSQTNGYYSDAEENDSRNCMLRIFRSHGNILYNDEFHSEETFNQDNFQITGRVKRVFTAIDKIREYKAACEDGADLSASFLVDFDIVWRDHYENVLHPGQMYNLQQVKDEINKRPAENTPIKAFWMGQEIQRCKWTSVEVGTNLVQQNHPNATNYINYSTVIENYYDAYDPRSQRQQFPGNFGKESKNQLSTVLDPTTAAFAPAFDNAPLLSHAEEPVISSETQQEMWWESDEDYIITDGIFIPKFCVPDPHQSGPRPSWSGDAAPKSIGEEHSEPEIWGPAISLERCIGKQDSGYVSGSTSHPVNGYAAATNGSSGCDVHDKNSISEDEDMIYKVGNVISKDEGSQSERMSDVAGHEISDYEVQQLASTAEEEFQAFLRSYGAYNLHRPFRCDRSHTVDEIRMRNRTLRWLAGINLTGQTHGWDSTKPVSVLSLNAL